MHLIQKFIGFVLIIFLILTGCQRFDPPKEQTGLDKDNKTYSYMGYPDTKLKQVVESIHGVERATTDYDGQRIVMRVSINSSIPRNQINHLKQEIRHRVNQAAPLNPIHIIIQQDS